MDNKEGTGVPLRKITMGEIDSRPATESMANVMGKNNFEITVRPVPNGHVVTLAGVLDATRESALTNTLTPLCESDTPYIIIDCDQLVYLNSASFGLFFHFYRQCEAKQGRLAMCRLPSKIESIFKLLGLYQVLNIYPTLEAALADMPAVHDTGN